LSIKKISKIKILINSFLKENGERMLGELICAHAITAVAIIIYKLHPTYSYLI